MPESSTPERVDRAGQALTPEKSPELLAVYGRLLALYNEHLRSDEFNPYQSILLIFLKSFNPALQIRIWRNFRRQTAPFWNTSNTLPQGLVGGDAILRRLEALDDQILRGVAECSRINLRRLLRRSVLGWLPKTAGVLAVLIALPKSLKEGFGVDLLAILTQVVPLGVMEMLRALAIDAFIGLVVGSIGNWILLMPRVGFVQALDDLIAISAAHRGTAKKE